VRRAHLTPALVVLALLSGCSRCGAPRVGPPPERFVPATNSGAFVVPVIAEAARQAAALHGALAARPGGEALGQVRAGLSQQLTFDVFDPESLRGAGLDVQRGLAVAELATRPGEPGSVLLVLPVGDAARLEAQVVRLAQERLGAGDRGQQAANGVAFTVWRRAAGEPALLSVARAEGSLLLAIGPTGPDVLRVVLALDPAVSLAESPSWKRGRAALGEGFPLLFFAPRDAPALLDLPATDGVAAGLSASTSGLRLALAAMLGAQEPRVRPLAGPGEGSSQPSRLDPATVVALRLSADPAVALRLVSEQRGQALIEPVAALAAQLATPVEVGVGLAPRADLNALVGGRALAQPLRVARLEALAGLKDPAAFTAACDQLMALLGAPAGHGTWTMGGGDAEVAWAVQGKAVALSAGVAGGLPPLRARLQAGGRGFEPPAGTAGALAGGLGGVVLHGDNLVTALRALPPSAFGAGPDAVVGRSLADKLIGSLGQGAALALRADLPAGALKLTLDLKLGTLAAAPPH
jgi:hypothetical protein